MSFKGKHTEETKAKISATQKRRYQQNPALYQNIVKARAVLQELRRAKREQRLATDKNSLG